MTGTYAVRVDFVIIGAQRSGSSYLNACLRDHPELFLCRDEVPYFEDRFFRTTPPSALAAVFAPAKPGQRLGIHRPEYLALPECAANIHAVAPDARILAVLRDPVARAVSAYCWYVQFGLLPFAPLDVGMERLLDGWGDPAYPHAEEILDFGFYGRHLRRYVETFGRERVFVLTDEELAVPAALPRAYEFLGADPGHRARFSGRPRNAGVYDLRRLRFLRARRKLAWSWDDVAVFEYRARRLRRPLRFLPNAAIVGIDRLVLTRVFGNTAPTLRSDLHARLRLLYASDVLALEAMLERDLSAWRDEGVAAPSKLA